MRKKTKILLLLED